MHGRVFTEENPPPSGTPMVLENRTHQRLLWTGHRWYDTATSTRAVDPWPPDPFIYGPSPWYEVTSS